MQRLMLVFSLAGHKLRGYRLNTLASEQQQQPSAIIPQRFGPTRVIDSRAKYRKVSLKTLFE
jgi:hypothetical protein